MHTTLKDFASGEKYVTIRLLQHGSIACIICVSTVSFYFFVHLFVKIVCVSFIFIGRNIYSTTANLWTSLPTRDINSLSTLLFDIFRATYRPLEIHFRSHIWLPWFWLLVKAWRCFLLIHVRLINTASLIPWRNSWLHEQSLHRQSLICGVNITWVLLLLELIMCRLRKHLDITGGPCIYWMDDGLSWLNTRRSYELIPVNHIFKQLFAWNMLGCWIHLINF